MSASPAVADSIHTVIGRIAGTISSTGFPTGERATLRRMTPDQPLPLAFYRFALRYLPPGWDRSLKEQRDWATLVAAIAVMSPSAHRPDQGLGATLGKSGFSEARLERLLQSTGDTRRSLLLRAARFMAAKNMACNWVDGAWFLLTPDANMEARERVIRKIARDFYNTHHESER